jgi:hypothetical protein
MRPLSKPLPDVERGFETFIFLFPFPMQYLEGFAQKQENA